MDSRSLRDVDEIRAYGQTIVYTIHETIGHLGIFVSSSVARKEHGEFSSNIDLIDTLPPGLYEAVFEEKTADTHNPDLAGGGWVMRCEMRTLDDIRALGGNDAADERRFAAAARVSEMNLANYRTFVQPVVRALVNSPWADFMQQLHPLRLQYEALSNANPFMASVSAMAERVRAGRQPAAADNPFLALQEQFSQQIVAGLDAWRNTTEALSEKLFMSIYGAPTLQAAVGIDHKSTLPPRKAAKSVLHWELIQKRIARNSNRASERVESVKRLFVRSCLLAWPGRQSTNGASKPCVKFPPRDGRQLPVSVQSDRPRTVLHAASGCRCRTCCNSVDAPADAGQRTRAFNLIKRI